MPKPVRRPRTVLWGVFPVGLLLLPLLSLQDASLHGRSDVPAYCLSLAPPWLVDDVPRPVPGRGPALDVVTYNLHSGLGQRHARSASAEQVEGRLAGIAEEMTRAGAPDVVGLNEVDFASRRSGWIDQAARLAAQLESRTGYTYSVVRGPTWRRDAPRAEVVFGNAVLTRHPVIEAVDCLYAELDGCGVSADGSPPHPAGLLSAFTEPRGVIRVTVSFDGRPLDVLVTHLEAFSTAARERQAQLLEAVVRPGRATVLMGDINAVPSAMTAQRWYFAADRTHDVLSAGHLADARVLRASVLGHRDLDAWATFPAHAPRWPLDAVFGSRHLWPEAVTAVGAAQSDHLGLHVRYQPVDPQDPASGALHERIKRAQLARLRACDGADPSRWGPAQRWTEASGPERG